MSNYFRIGANSDGSYRNAGRSGLVPTKTITLTKGIVPDNTN